MAKVYEFLAFALLLPAAQSALQLASYYSDHMVLQRGPQHAVLWGTADTEGDTVTAQVIGQGSQVTTTVKSGTWKLKLPAITDPGPFVINVTSGDGQVTLNDVLFGDVWICSGQSNMQFGMRGVINGSAELDEGVTKNTIRLMMPKRVTSDTALTNLTVAQPWTAPTRRSLPSFSAVCFLFAKYLQPHLNYPIGLVGTYWGGTKIEAWSPAEASASCTTAPLPQSLPTQNQPQHLWNSMVSPLLSMTITGALWYQGESNAGHPTDYSCQMPALVREWRSQFHQQSLAETRDDFPFGYVQIGDLANSSAVGAFPALRWAQTANHGYSPNTDMPNTFMAVAMDLPDFESPNGPIHPRYKQDVADRLVLGALHVAYGQTDVVFQGPFPSSFSLDPADHSLTVQYDVNTLSSVEIRNDHGFDVCCSTHVTCNHPNDWVEVPIKNHDQTHVTLNVSTCEAPKQVLGVRYAWRQTPCDLKQCAVYDTDSGLPAPPFIQESLSSGSGIIG